jgi:hypothetical protein
MKKYHTIKCALIALGCSALIHSTSMAQTTLTNSYTNSFPTAGNTTYFTGGSVASWIYWYGLGFGNTAITNDPSMDAQNQTNTSGSLYVSLPFTNSGDQAVFFGTFDNAYGYDGTVLVPLTLVTQIAFDIHVAPGTKTNSSGTFGNITMALLEPGWNGSDFGLFSSIPIPASATNGWVHMVDTNIGADLLKAEVTYAQAAGIGFNYNSYGGYPTNPVTFWIDNASVTLATVAPPPPPPPTVSLSPAVAGLNLFAGQGSSLYNRENIETVNNNYSWVNASGPVSYSFTITNYPIKSGDAFQTQIFLVPNPGTESDPDWNEPNLIFLDMESTANGASATFRYKTNEPNGNTMVYGVGSLATVNSSNVQGTWTLTFNQNTNVTITTPSGTSTNFSIPDSTGATSALFQSGVVAYFGVQAGNAGAANDHIVASSFSVSGLGSGNFTDNFVSDALTNGNLNLNIWETNASFSTGVQFIGGGSPYWVSWTQPAIGYSLVESPVLGKHQGANWLPVSTDPSFTAGVNYTQLISTNDLPRGKTNAFFALVQRTFSQLLVVLPGQTNAPNTTNGLTGTPTPNSAGATAGQELVTVMAVDSQFNPVSGISDTIKLSSTDPGASLPGNQGTTGNMVNGVVTFTGNNSFFFSGNPGNFTITATDTSNTSIPPATSSPVTVTQ